MDILEILKKYLIPYEKHTYGTVLSVKEIQKVLNDVVEPKQYIRFRGFLGNSNHKEFEGSVSENSFRIEKITKKNNSNTPFVIGEMTSSLNNKTTVKLTLRLKYFPLIFLAIWLLIVFGSSNAFQFNFDFSGSGYFPLLFIPIILVILVATFKYQAKKSKRSLERLLKLEAPTDAANSWITRT